MKTTLFTACACLLFSAPVIAQKKPDPYNDCRKSGKSIQECQHLMDPSLQRAIKGTEETGRRSATHLEQQKRKDEELRRQVQQGR